jgi:hypothetical protein
MAADEAKVRYRPVADSAILVPMIGAAVVGIMADDVFSEAVMFASFIACFAVWRTVSDAVVVTACAILVFGAVLGWGLNFYDRIWWYDDAAHFTFSLVASMAVARVMIPKMRAETVAFILTGIWLAWLGVGSLWEIGEWTADRLQNTHHSRGYADTMMDMILNTTGSAIGVVLYWRFLRTPVDEASIIEFDPQR